MQLDYINGNKFADLAHFVINPQEGKGITNEMVRDDAIIFCKTDYLDYFFKNIQFSPRKYILITHFSDYTIDSAKFSQKPPNIKKWFAQNAEFDHPDLISVPIGLENTRSEHGTLAGQDSDIEWLFTNQEKYQDQYKNTEELYCSFKVDYQFASGVWTNPHRKNVIPSIEGSGVKYVEPTRKLPFREYCDIISQYFFIPSPQGNGIDCHKTWEILYMGSVPIVIKNRIYRDYNLPILQLNSWDDLSPQLLDNYIEYTNQNDFNDFEELTMNFWKEKIENEFKKL